MSKTCSSNPGNLAVRLIFVFTAHVRIDDTMPSMVAQEVC